MTTWIDKFGSGFGMGTAGGVLSAGASGTLTGTIPDTNIDGNLTDFTVPLVISSSAGTGAYDMTQIFTDLGANKLKLKCTDSTGATEYYVEVAYWDDTAQQAVLWVKIPSILAASGAVFKLSWDASWADNTTYVGTPGQAVVENAWDSDHVGVYHMGVGGSNELVQSLASWVDIPEANGSPAADSASLSALGNSVAYAHADADMHENGAADEYDWGAGTDDITCSVLVKPASVSPAASNYYVVFSADNTGAGGQIYMRMDPSEDMMSFYWRTSTWLHVTSTVSQTPGTWYFVSGKRSNDGASVRSIVTNLTRDSGATEGTGLGNFGYNHNIGNSQAIVATGAYDGSIAEVILSKVYRADEWEKALYYGVNDGLIAWS